MTRAGLSLAVIALSLAGCIGPTQPSAELPARPSPDQVLAWADIDRNLGRHPGRLDYGKADGRSTLGEKVMVLNGEEMVRFVRAHGYAGHGGATAAMSPGRSLTRIHVEIRGRDGATLTLILESDGEDQGRG